MFRLSVLRGRSRGAAEQCRGVARWLAGPAIVWCLLAGAGVGHAQSHRPSNTHWWVPSGPVYAVALTDSTVYLGGDFQRVGPNTGQGVPLDLSSAQPWADYPHVGGYVRACVADGAGGWYIGGDFTKVGGVTRNRLAHILADGTLDPVWNPNSNGTVVALAVSDDGSTVYAGGYFATVNGGTTRRFLAAFNTSDGTATAWDPDCNDTVHALAVSADGSAVYAGGEFTTVNGGTVRHRLAAFNTTDGTASAWNPDCDEYAAYALAVDGSTVYVGGWFTTVNGGTVRNGLAAFNTTDGTATAWNPDCDDGVYALAVDGGVVYAGGWFETINGGTARHYLAAFNTTDGTATAWNPDCGGDYSGVYALTVSPDGSTVYAGGWFDTVNGGTVRNCLAAFNTTDGTATAWDPECGGGGVYALAISGSALYAGGGFTVFGGVARTGLVALDRATGHPTAWHPDCDGTVEALAVAGSTVYAGGRFWRVNGGTKRHCLAAFNTTDGTATAWNPDCDGGNYGTVCALAISGGTVYAGGWFWTVNGGTKRHCLAAFNTTDGTATAWNPDCNNQVSALAISGGTVYAGGWFWTVNGGTKRHCLAAFNTTDGTATAWNPDCEGGVEAMAVSCDGSTVYAGGWFDTDNGGTALTSLAAFNTTDGTATAWNPDCSGSVFALVVDGDTVYAGGGFTTVNGGTTRQHLAAFNTTDGTATAWNPDCDDGVYALAVDGGAVYAGGWFSFIGHTSCPYFAVFPALRKNYVFNHDNGGCAMSGHDTEARVDGWWLFFGLVLLATARRRRQPVPG